MKKLFLFIGVIMLCLLFSCKKDSSSSQPPPPPPPIDSFLLHPPPVLDSLPLPLTIGTWWKYQRIDSSFEVWVNRGLHQTDSTTELITVIGKTPYFNVVYDLSKIPYRVRYDTVNAFMLEVKNLTKGTLDTNYAEYYNSTFSIFSYKTLGGPYPYFTLMLPQVDGGKGYGDGFVPFYNFYYYNYVKKDTAVSVFDNLISSCNYTYSSGADNNINALINITNSFLKPKVGFVQWKIYLNQSSHYGETNTYWYYRRLIDYHIAP